MSTTKSSAAAYVGCKTGLTMVSAVVGVPILIELTLWLIYRIGHAGCACVIGSPCMPTERGVRFPVRTDLSWITQHESLPVCSTL